MMNEKAFDIKDFILDGEYVRGNLLHENEVREWLINKANYSMYMACNNEDIIFFVNAYSGKLQCIMEQSSALYRIVEQFGTEVKPYREKVERFNSETLQPFDKVLVRDNDRGFWRAMIFSHIYSDMDDYKHLCTDSTGWRCCIPYNEDTEHLVGKKDDAPEYYRYWED